MSVEGGSVPADVDVQATSAVQQVQAHAEQAVAAQGGAQTAASDGRASAAAASQAARQAQDAAAVAQDHADKAAGASSSAQAAAVLANSGSEPGWVYALVIGFLGAALLALIAVIVVTALKGKGINTDVMSATTLILGGLIGVLAPSPGRRQ
jgi:hypothetical protein